MSTSLPYSEKELLVRIAEGDHHSFSLFYKKHAALLRAYVLKTTSSGTATEEILQAVFIRVWLSRDKLPEVENIKAWLYAVTAKMCLQYFRNEKRYAQLQEASPPPSMDMETPFDLFQVRLLKQMVQSVIEKMPERRKLVFRLSRQSGAKPREIAQQLSMSVGTVKNHLYEANLEIRTFLKEHGYADLLMVCLLLQVF